MEDFFNAVSGEMSDAESLPPEDDEFEAASNQSAASQELGILYQEYRRAIDAIARQFDQIIRVATIGFSAAGALLVLVANGYPGSDEPFQFDEWVYWLAPLMLTLLYAWVMNMLYQITFSSYYVRELEDEIAKHLEFRSFHHENSVVRVLSSFRTAYFPCLITIVMPLLFAFVIYATLVGVSFFKLKGMTGDHYVPPWRLALFVATQCALSASLIIGALGITAQLRTKYDFWKTKSSSTTHADDRRYRKGARVWGILSYAVLPRLFEFVFKSPITIISVVVTALILHVPMSLTLIVASFWVVICIEFLAKQATYIWNDVLDIEADQRHPYKYRTRLLAQLQKEGYPARRIGVALFLGRAIASIAVAAIIAHDSALDWLPALVVFIFVWQFIYDRWAKQKPVRRIVVASLGYGERALAGSLTVMSVAGFYDPVLMGLLAMWIIVFMFVVLSEYWWAERRYQWKEKFKEPFPGTGDQAISAPPRIWFLDRAPTFERRANALLFCVGLVLAYLYADASSNQLQALVSAFRSFGSSLTRHLAQVDNKMMDLAGLSWNLDVLGSPFLQGGSRLATVGATMVGGIFVMTAIHAFMDPGKRFRWLATGTAAFLVAILVVPSALRFATIALGLPILVAIQYERLSYEEITSFEQVLKKLTRARPRALVGWLFYPRGVRISIEPFRPTPADEPGDWPDTLSKIYAEWSDAQSLKRPPVKGDGGSPLDLLIEGSWSSLWRLCDESGLHSRRVRSVNAAGVVCFVSQQFAMVDVRPVSVLAAPEMGNGLESLGAISDSAQSAEAESVVAFVRSYDCDPTGLSGRLKYSSLQEFDCAGQIAKARKEMGAELLAAAQRLFP